MEDPETRSVRSRLKPDVDAYKATKDQEDRRLKEAHLRRVAYVFTPQVYSPNSDLNDLTQSHN